MKVVGIVLLLSGSSWGGVEAFVTQPRGGSSTKKHGPRPIYLGAMDELAREWTLRNRDVDSSPTRTTTKSSGGGGTAVMTMVDPSLPPGGQDFNTINYSASDMEAQSRIKGWVAGTTTETKPTVQQVKVGMNQLQQEWSFRNKDAEQQQQQTTIRRSSSSTYDPVPVKPRQQSPSPVSAPTYGGMMDQLQREWASRNKEAIPSSTAIMPPPPMMSFAAPAATVSVPKPTQTTTTSSSSTSSSSNNIKSYDDLAKAWASRNKDADSTMTTNKATTTMTTTTTKTKPPIIETPVGSSIPRPTTTTMTSGNMEDLAKQWASRNKDIAAPPKATSTLPPPPVVEVVSKPVDAAAVKTVAVTVVTKELKEEQQQPQQEATVKKVAVEVPPKPEVKPVVVTPVVEPILPKPPVVEEKAVAMAAPQPSSEDELNVPTFPIKFWVSVGATFLTLVPIVGQLGFGPILPPAPQEVGIGVLEKNKFTDPVSKPIEAQDKLETVVLETKDRFKIPVSPQASTLLQTTTNKKEEKTAVVVQEKESKITKQPEIPVMVTKQPEIPVMVTKQPEIPVMVIKEEPQEIPKKPMIKTVSGSVRTTTQTFEEVMNQLTKKK